MSGIFDQIRNIGMVIGVVLLFVFLWVWGVFNDLIRKRNQLKTDLSDTNVQLGRKLALVDRLTDMVREYAKHEKSTFEDVAKARSAIETSKDVKDSAKAENMLTQSLKSLMLVVESYPKLSASQNFQELRTDLKQIEADIADRREQYNLSVQEYNNSLQTFPNLLLSKLLGFEEGVLFGTSEIN